jgi:hypothetical protein
VLAYAAPAKGVFAAAIEAAAAYPSPRTILIVLVEATLCVVQCGLGKLGFELRVGYLREAP